MSQQRRFPWKFLLFLCLLVAAALYFGGGLWGPGGGRFREKVDAARKLAQDTPAALRRKIDSLREIAAEKEGAAEEAAKREAREQSEKLAKVMEAWAEDRYSATKEKVERLLDEGKAAAAREELESVPKEYWSTKFGPEFEALKKKIP